MAAKKKLKVYKDLATYCEIKLLGVCMVRKESYCCYNSPLAKILNEQIKSQLGMDFVSPESPAAPVSELLTWAVDWTKVNLDEWLAIMAQMADRRPQGRMTFGCPYGQTTDRIRRLGHGARNDAA